MLCHPRRLSENKALKRATLIGFREILNFPEIKFKIDQNLHNFDVMTRSWRTYPVYFYLYCRVCNEISKRWTD
jgi:hypothetical protein